jgi:hypothetical protein
VVLVDGRAVVGTRSVLCSHEEAHLPCGQTPVRRFHSPAGVALCVARTLCLSGVAVNGSTRRDRGFIGEASRDVRRLSAPPLAQRAPDRAQVKGPANEAAELVVHELVAGAGAMATVTVHLDHRRAGEIPGIAHSHGRWTLRQTPRQLLPARQPSASVPLALGPSYGAQTRGFASQPLGLGAQALAVQAQLLAACP